MSPSSVTALAWLAGITFPAFVIWNAHPSRRRMVLALVASGALTGGLITFQRGRPAPEGRNWRKEMLVDGVRSGTRGGDQYAIPGLVAWLLIWAALMEEPTKERGSWLLALIPLVLVGAMFALRSVGPGAPVPSGLAILAGVVVAYLFGVLAYWHLRRS
jgi:hypothetical protein